MGKNDQRRRDILPPGEADWFRATSSTAITAGQLVRVLGLAAGGAYYTVVAAIADGTQTGRLLVAVADIPADGHGWAKKEAVLTLDTSAATLGDPVYLSASVAGALTLTESPEQVGWAADVATAGQVSTDPVAASASTPGAWSSLSSFTVGNWTNVGNTGEYRVVGDKVELRGYLLGNGGTQTVVTATVLQAFPPAELRPAGSPAGVWVPGVFSDDTGASSYGCMFGITNKFTVDHYGSTGTPVVGDLLYLDGISWSITP